MTFGEKLQELRKGRNLSQEQFAEQMAVSRQAVSKWELNQAYPEMDKLIELSEYFNVTMDSLVKDQTVKTSEEIKTSGSKSFNFVTMFILITMAMIMTSFRFFITNDHKTGLLILVPAVLIGLGLLIFKRTAESK